MSRKGAAAVGPLDFSFDPIIAGILRRDDELTAVAGLGIARFPNDARAVDILAFDLDADGIGLADLKLLRSDDASVGGFPSLVLGGRERGQEREARETARLVQVHKLAHDTPTVAPAIIHRIWGGAAF